MVRRVFIFGAGYSGRAIARELAPVADSIAGTTRNTATAPTLSGNGIIPLLYEGRGFSPELRSMLRATTHLLTTIAPNESGDPVLADLVAAGRTAMPALQWIGYLSTVGVYGDHDCGWVDEESECRPSSARSRGRLEAESAWRAFGRGANVPVAILRLPGIYGPGRNAFVNLAAGRARRIVKPGQVFNRIHLDDIAGATAHLMRTGADGVFNVADDEPSPPQDVVAYAAALMGIEPPPEIPFAEADLSPMGRSFYCECKRVSNAKLKASGYALRHVNYRQALTAMWSLKSWESEHAANML